MKKILCCLMIMILALFCFGCNNTSNTEPISTEPTSTEPAPPEKYVYTISCLTTTVKSNNGANIINVTDITTKCDEEKNPTELTVSFKATKTYQGDRLGLMHEYTEDNTVYVILYDVNGNQIGKKEVVTKLKAKGSSSNYTTYFEVAPGTYSIKILSEEDGK